MTSRRWVPVAWIAACVPCALLNAVIWLNTLRQGAIYTDFGGYYALARLGLAHGWASLYDLDQQRAAWMATGPLHWYPNMYPPLVAWVVSPLTALPFPVAYGVWSLSMLVLLLVSWWIGAAGSRLERTAQLVAALGLLPAGFGLYIGQVLFVDLAAVLVCWWLLSRRREFAAGAVLAATAVKPQLAFLVPVALLASYRLSSFGGWLLASAIVILAESLAIGPASIQIYVARLQAAPANPALLALQPDQSLPGLLGYGPAAAIAQGVVLAAVAAVGWRYRRSGPEIPIAAGLCGSLLATPFLHVEDFTLLLAAGWLYLRTRPRGLDVALLAVGYTTLQLALGGGLAIVPFEVAWLCAMLIRRPPVAPEMSFDPAGRPEREPVAVSASGGDAEAVQA